MKLLLVTFTLLLFTLSPVAASPDTVLSCLRGQPDYWRPGFRSLATLTGETIWLGEQYAGDTQKGVDWGFAAPPDTEGWVLLYSWYWSGDAFIRVAVQIFRAASTPEYLYVFVYDNIGQYAPGDPIWHPCGSFRVVASDLLGEN